MSMYRASHTATRLANGTVLVAGGLKASGSVSQQSIALAEIFNPVSDPATETWSLLPATGVPRYNFSTGLLPGGALLAAGGWANSSASVVLSSTEIYFPPVSP